MNTLLDPVIHRYLIGSFSFLPDYLPWHKPLVLLSGFFEIAGGIGLTIPDLQSYASWGLILLLLAVFPANIEMFFRNYQKRQGFSLFVWALLVRLPLQFLLIWWVYWSGLLN